MKLGVITDIHNNYIALEAVLNKFKPENIDGVICCGDILGIGPYPEETVQMVEAIPNLIAFVRGNHERYLVEGMPTEVPNSENMSYAEMEHHKWEHSLLSDDSKNFIAGLKDEEFLEINGKHIYVTHYPTLEYPGADIILFGHDHKGSVSNSYFNCGSLGCPHKSNNIARAGILIIDDEYTFTELNIEYDVAKVIAEIERLQYPDYGFILQIFYNVNKNM